MELPHDGPVILRLAPVPQIRGRVLDPMGRPAAAQVRAWDERTNRTLVCSTEDDGTFTLKVPGPSEYSLRAESHEFFASPSRSVELLSQSIDLTLQLRQVTELHGLVVRPTGEPVPRVSIGIRPQGTDLPGMPSYNLHTDDQGLFRWRVAEGLSYNVSAVPPSWWGGRRYVAEDVRPGPFPVRIVVPAVDFTGRCRLQVLESDGTPARITHAGVWSRGDGQDIDRRLQIEPNPLRPSELESEGTLVIDNLPVGEPFTVSVTTVTTVDRHSATGGPWIASGTGTHHVIRLPALSSIVCQVVPRDGVLMTDVRVMAARVDGRPEDERGSNRFPDEFGYCEFDRLMPGKWTVWLKDWKDDPGQTFELGPGATHRVTLRVPAQ